MIWMKTTLDLCLVLIFKAVNSRNGFKKRIGNAARSCSRLDHKREGMVTVFSFCAFLLALGRTEPKVVSQKKTLSSLKVLLNM